MVVSFLLRELYHLFYISLRINLLSGTPLIQESKSGKLPWLDVKNIQVTKGRGISGSLTEGEVLIGNKKFIQGNGIPISPGQESEANEQELNGATPIWIALSGKWICLIFLADQPRKETKPTLDVLRRLGYSLVMLTGDHPKVAAKIAERVGVTEVKASLLLQGKIEAIIKELKCAKKQVLMVGDGINDAPALAEANVGVAMGLRRVEITLESAQAVLIHDNLSVIPQVFSVAKQTFRIIRIDLILAMGIHAVAAGLVLGGKIGILGSTVIHQISSALVLLNTLRLFSIKTVTLSESAELLSFLSIIGDGPWIGTDPDSLRWVRSKVKS